MLLGWMNMTDFKRGDVVLVRFPHSNLMSYKKRPALVVQDDRIKTGLEQRIIVQITSNMNRTGPSRVPVSRTSESGHAMGILQDSVIMADSIATVLPREIERAIGKCPIMDEVDAALRIILGLG
jgi:mRNA interferase MazF